MGPAVKTCPGAPVEPTLSISLSIVSDDFLIELYPPIFTLPNQFWPVGLFMYVVLAVFLYLAQVVLMPML